MKQGARKAIGKGFAILLAGGIALLGGQGICAAEIVTGQAAIIQGDVDRARRDAREDAMRSYVERQVGVYVNSRTETDMGMVVVDRVVSQSTGYVQIKDVKKEWRQGEIYLVELDLEAGTTPIESAVADVRKRMQMQLDGTTRTAIQVAVTGRDEGGQRKDLMRLNTYLQSKMEDISGFRVTVNEEVRRFMEQRGDMGNMSDSAEARRIARTTREGEEDTLLRGTLSTAGVRKEGSAYVATVNASFELVGLDDNMTSSFSDYFTAAGTSHDDAVHKAEEMATRRAAENLGQKALEVIQRTQRGGVARQLQATLLFQNITDRAGQEQRILQGLAAANCRVIRSTFTGNGEYKVFLKSAAYDSLGSLRMGVLQNVPGVSSGNENESAMGSTILYFMF